MDLDAVRCTLKLLPLNRSVIDSQIYIQNGHWPIFNESGIALGVRDLVPLRLSWRNFGVVYCVTLFNK